jgi:hypothetical protein
MYELSEQDPTIDQPDGLTIELKYHQRTLAYRCIMLEQGKQINPAYKINTKMGVICDKVGSGKSYTMLSIILNNNEIATYYNISRINSHSSVLVPEVYHTKIHIKTNILVVPSAIVQQWIMYLENTTLKYKCVYNQKTLDNYFGTSDNGHHINELCKTDIVLIGSKVYGNWFKIADQFGYYNFIFRRMIIDEVVDIMLPNNKAVHADFYWFITASYESSNIKNNGFIRQTWTFYNDVKYAIFMKNNDKFVDQSMGLYESKIMIIESNTTKTEKILAGFVPISIIKTIAATTEEYAQNQFMAEYDDKELLEDNHGKITKSIVNVIVADMYKKVHNMKIKLNALADMQLVPKQKELRSNKIAEKIKIVETRIEQLKTRISECNIDPVTMEEINTPVITECCKQLFNESTINELYKINPDVQCPMCRHPLTVIKVIEPIVPGVKAPSAHLTRLENLRNVMDAIYAKNGLNTKLLIFSEHDKTFELIDGVLSQYPMIYTIYIGDTRILEQYKKRNINILLLNANSHSAGLNLENTTDIIIYHEMTPDMETQIIGRANRLGRTIGRLNVWKFV